MWRSNLLSSSITGAILAVAGKPRIGVAIAAGGVALTRVGGIAADKRREDEIAEVHGTSGR